MNLIKQGLSEMVHSESVNLENFKVSRYTNKEKLDSDKKEESNEENLYKNNQNSYVLICSTRQVEYYVIDRSAYLSQLHDGDTYKFQSHIDNLVNFVNNFLVLKNILICLQKAQRMHSNTVKSNAERIFQ